MTELEAAVKSQAAEIERLRGLLGAQTTGQVAKPPVVDKVDQLAHHPTLPPYGKRTRPISMIVVHHTDTPKTMAVEKIAEYHVYGERKDAKGNVIKAQWPGIGYHFLVGPGRRDHAGPAGVDPLVPRRRRPQRLQRRDQPDRPVHDARTTTGPTAPPEDQEPTPLQLKSAGQLAAWLMQEYKIPIEQIKGHRDVWPKATVCPGEHWKAGLNWYPKLVQAIQAAQRTAGGLTGHPIPLYLLLWDHGNAWAEADWRSAQGYIARFRPTAGFSVDDALLAQRVVIVGGPAGVSGQDEARLRAAGVEVYRLAGKDEADTKRMLDELAQKGTPWPGAPAQAATPRDMLGLEGLGAPEEPAFPDEWTMPDEWALSEPALYEDHPQQPAYAKDFGELFGRDLQRGRPPALPKVFVPPPEGEPAGTGGSHE